MKDFPQTLAAFFLPENGTEGGKEILDAAKLEDQIKGLPEAGFGGREGVLFEALRSALDLPFLDIILKAWGGLEELQDTLGQGGDGSEVELVKPLVKHSIRSEHKPRLEVLYENTLLAEIVIDVELTAELEGFVLHIKGGHIVEIATGSITAGGKLGIAGKTLLELSSSPYALPGRLRPDPPFAIPRLA